MRNILLFLVPMILFIGCASSAPKSYVSTSSPIFVLEKPKDNNIFVDFKDSYEPSNNIQIFLEDALKKEKFKVVYNEQIASTVVKGTINYLKKIRGKNTRGFVSMGIGFGSRGRISRNIDIGVEHSIFGGGFGDGYYRDYGYDGQASLLIRIKNRDNYDNYSTNLNFLTDDNIYSKELAQKMFNRQIAKKVIEYLND